jgi:hypothetical protein
VNDGMPWRRIVRGMLGLVFVLALLCTPLAFALAYPHCAGARMTNCGIGPALLLFGSLLSSGIALVVGALLLLLWQAQPMTRGVQIACKLFTGVAALFLLGCLVILNP